MIDEPQVAPLVHIALQMPAASRIAMLDGLTHLHLTPAAWQCAAKLAWDGMATLDEGTETAARAVGVLARVPLRSIRTALQTRANDAGSVAARHVAPALASQGDAAAVPALMCAFAAGQTADLAEALAALLQPGLGVDAEDLRPGLAADDEMTRLWTAIAIARVQRRDGSGPDFEPLEQVWDALNRNAKHSYTLC